MRRIRAVVLSLAGWFQRARREQELNDELESNLEFHVEDNIRAGMSPIEARRQAILKFGGIESTKQECRDRLGLPLIDSFLYDLRYGIRSLARDRMFTAVAVATLAFGIGSTTAMFTIAKAILIPPLPYFEPDRLAGISEVNRLSPAASANVASEDVADWRRMNTVFSDIAEYVGIDERGKARVNLFLTGSGETSVLKGLVVSKNLLDVLGVAPMLGRNFAHDDVDHVAILSYSCWQYQFGGDPRIAGQTIMLGGISNQVIGVMPRGFFFPNQVIDVFILPGEFTPNRIFHDEGVVARLRPGVSLDQARVQMEAIGARLRREHPDTNANVSHFVENWRASLGASSRPALFLLLAAIGILFAIVCSNVAHLQLGRAASRIQELTIRKALGASRGRLVRQLLTESLLLSALGGLLGLGLASAACSAAPRLAAGAIPPYADLRIDAWVILFNIAVTLLTPAVFGIGPALSSARQESLRDHSRASAHSTRKARGLLIAGEVALSVVLVVSAGLLVRSLVRLMDVDLGFRAGNAISFRFDPSSFIPSEEQRARLFATIETRLLEQPGIEAVGATARPVLGGGSGGESPVTILGRERTLRLELATPSYLQAMQSRLLQGRFLTPFDAKTSGVVAVVNAAFERTYYPDTSAVGKHIGLGRRGAATIVGVVSDLKQEAIDGPAQPAAFLSSNQIVPHAVTFIVRGRGDARELATAAREAVRSVDKSITLTDVVSLNGLVEASVSAQRARTSLLSLAAVAALLLSALGVYGVLAYSVAQRSTEISIRMALGAPLAKLFGMVVLEGLYPVLAGAAVGFAGAYAAGGLIRSLLFGIVPEDPATYLSTALILAAVAFSACAAPAMKAIRLDPMAALRRQ